jgi:hypothetical protein
MMKKVEGKNEFHWTTQEFLVALVAGVFAAGILWLFSSLLIGLFM